MSDTTLKKRTVTALFWSFLDKFGQKVVFLISSVFLMRLLDISAYGIMGSLLIFVAFSSLLIDSGFGRALLNRKEISALEYSTVFYFNLGISLFLYIALFFFSSADCATIQRAIAYACFEGALPFPYIQWVQFDSDDNFYQSIRFQNTN